MRQPRMTYAEVQERDRVRLLRPLTCYEGGRAQTWPAGATGVVTMKCRDGLTGRPMVRVHFLGHDGEPFISFPTDALEYADG